MRRKERSHIFTQQLLEFGRKYKTRTKNEEERRQLDKRTTDALTVKAQLEHVQSVNNSVQIDGNYIEKYKMHLVIQNKLTQATVELREMLKIDKRFERYLDWDRPIQSDVFIGFVAG